MWSGYHTWRNKKIPTKQYRIPFVFKFPRPPRVADRIMLFSKARALETYFYQCLYHQSQNSIPPINNRSSKSARLKNRSNKLRSKLKNDHLLSLYIAVDRFLKDTLSLDRFMKHALKLDRFFFGGIEFLIAPFFETRTPGF